MISPEKIHELATLEQTSDINIAREYLQHLFLSTFYKRPGSDQFLFKGGTAIRIVFGGVRYSEDLDFSIPRLSKQAIEDLLVETFSSLQVEGVIHNLTLNDATPTTGGYIADISLDILGFRTGIKSNLQVKDNPADLRPESELIGNPPFLPAYSLVILAREILVREKVQALIERSKPRDFFDLYFFIRHDQLKNYIPRDSATLAGITTALDRVSDTMLESDLREFLPINYRPVVKNLKTAIQQAMGIR